MIRYRFKHLLLICCLILGFMHTIPVQGEGLSIKNVVSDLKSKIRFYCDDRLVMIPPEMVGITLTFEPSQDQGPSGQDNTTKATVRIISTKFWDSVNWTIPNTSDVVHEIRTKGLLVPVDLRGRVLDAATQSDLDGICVKLTEESGTLLAQTVTDKDGFFTVQSHAREIDSNLSLSFSAKDYQEKIVEVTINNKRIDLITLEPSTTPDHEQELTMSDPQYNLMVVKAVDGLGLSVRNLLCTLSLDYKNGKVLDLQMSEKEGYYSVLIDKSTVLNVQECTINVEDTSEKWQSVKRKMPCQEAHHETIQLVLAGEPFASGVVATKSPKKCRVWLIRLTDDGASEDVHIVVTDDKGKFNFPTVPSKEEGRYRIAVSFDVGGGENTTPLWISPDPLVPRLSGHTNEYSLGRKIELKIPDNYLSLFQVIKVAQIGNQKSNVKIEPEYDRENDSIIDMINSHLKRAGKPKSVSVNAFKSFTLSIDNKPGINIKENCFGEGRWISLQESDLISSTVVAMFPWGNRNTISSMKTLVTDSINMLLGESTSTDYNLLLVCKDWFSSTKDWSKMQKKLEKVKIKDARRNSSFQYIIEKYLFEKLKEKKSNSLTINDGNPTNMTLVFDATFLNACKEDSFTLENIEMGDLVIFILSESFMGDKSSYEPLIKRLEHAFGTHAKSIKHEIINPVDTANRVEILKDIVAESISKGYSWIPVPHELSGKQEVNTETQEKELMSEVDEEQ